MLRQATRGSSRNLHAHETFPLNGCLRFCGPWRSYGRFLSGVWRSVGGRVVSRTLPSAPCLSLLTSRIPSSSTLSGLCRLQCGCPPSIGVSFPIVGFGVPHGFPRRARPRLQWPCLWWSRPLDFTVKFDRVCSPSSLGSRVPDTKKTHSVISSLSTCSSVMCKSGYGRAEPPPPPKGNCSHTSRTLMWNW